MLRGSEALRNQTRPLWECRTGPIRQKLFCSRLCLAHLALTTQSRIFTSHGLVLLRGEAASAQNHVLQLPSITGVSTRNRSFWTEHSSVHQEQELLDQSLSMGTGKPGWVRVSWFLSPPGTGTVSHFSECQL